MTLPPRISIVCISLYHDRALQKTLESLSLIGKSWAQYSLKVPLVVLVIANKPGRNEVLDFQKFTSLESYELAVLEGLDTGLYDAMNIGVKYAASRNCTNILFINAGVLINASVDLSKLSVSLIANPARLLMCDAREIIPLEGCKSRQRMWRPSLEKWQKHPYHMPACHHSIIYPLSLLERYPFLATKNFLVSDYLNIIQLLHSGSSFAVVDICLSEYVNDGLSSKKFCKSIFQRSIAFYMVYGRLFIAMRMFFFNIAKHFLAKSFSIR
jgi:hypothetical protein